MTVLDKIEAFADKWPNSLLGPARSLIADYDVKDVNLLYCMRMVTKELGKKPGDAELTATFMLLLAISEIDEYTRWRECWSYDERPMNHLSRAPLFGRR